MAGGRRVDGVEYAERINAAAELVEAGMPMVQAARVLAGRFAVSVRQACRYVERAAAGGRVSAPEETTVFTVRLPVGLAVRVRERASASGSTISALVAQALTELVGRGHGKRPRR